MVLLRRVIGRRFVVGRNKIPRIMNVLVYGWRAKSSIWFQFSQVDRGL